MDSADPRAAADRVELRHELTDEPMLWSDPGGILQVLNNLLCNAIKHSPGGGVATVRARLKKESVILDVPTPG